MTKYRLTCDSISNDLEELKFYCKQGDDGCMQIRTKRMIAGVGIDSLEFVIWPDGKWSKWRDGNLNTTVMEHWEK